MKWKWHGLWNLEKVLKSLEKSSNSIKVLEKYLISLLDLEKSLKFNSLFTTHHFLWKLLDYFSMENWLILGVRTCKTHG